MFFKGGPPANPIRPLEEYFKWYKEKEIKKGTQPVWLYMDGLIKVLPYIKH